MPKDEVTPDPESELSPREIWDIHNEGFLSEDKANGPCPVCGEPNGFHNDDVHRKDIDPKYLLKKGWHQK